jgi:VanZ family protein
LDGDGGGGDGGYWDGGGGWSGGFAHSQLSHFERGFGAQLPWIAFVAIAALVLAVAVRRSKPGPLAIHWPAAVLAAGSGLGIAVATLTPRGSAWAAGYTQLTPFHTIRGYLNGWETAQTLLFYVVGNVALFVPLALFLHLALRRSVWLTIGLGVLASVTVELLQLPIWSRSTDVDDVILNGIGAVAGAGLAAVVLRLPAAFHRPRLLFPPQPATA